MINILHKGVQRKAIQILFYWKKSKGFRKQDFAVNKSIQQL
jgi:hypothetical protein